MSSLNRHEIDRKIVDSRNSDGIPDYLAPGISDIFFRDLSRPEYVPVADLDKPLKENPLNIRRLSDYLRLGDFVLTKDIWQSRIITTTKMSSKYTITSTPIGFGVGGSVKRVLDRTTHRSYALKSLSTYTSSRRKLTSVFNEVIIYSQLDHPNIAFMHEVYDELGACHVLMEHCTGSELYDRLDTYKRFTENYAKKITLQMLLALTYLHRNGICHRDLKLENWVFSTEDIDSKIKMIDFGFARLYEEGIPMGGMHGTVYYVDPEVIDGCYSEKCDVWSTGVIVYMLLSGSPPFNGESDKEILWKIKKGSLKFEGVRWNYVSQTAKDFIRYLLNRDSKERPTAYMAMQHDWLKEDLQAIEQYSISKKMLKHIQEFSKKSALHRAVVSLAVMETDRDTPNEAYMSFFAMNTSKYGTISLQEFKKAMSMVDVSPEESARIFDVLGFRGFPELHYSEFAAAVFEHFTQLDVNNLSLVYKKLETYGNGVVNLAAFTQAFGEHFNGAPTREMFAEMDLNRDNITDFIEFCEFLLKGRDSEARLDDMTTKNGIW